MIDCTLGDILMRFLLVLIVAFLVACGSGDDDSGKLKVVASVLPVYVFAQNIVDGTADVELSLLLPPETGHVHGFSLTTRQASLLESADVVLLVGRGYEPFLTNHPALHRGDVVVVETSDGITPLPRRRRELDEHVRDEDNDVNHHFWVSPRGAAQMVRNIEKVLSRALPGRSDDFRANSSSYIDSLISLAEEFERVVASSSNPRLVTMHDAFDYLSRDAGLEIIEVIEYEAGVPPTSRRFAELVGFIERESPAAIASEPQFDDSPAIVLSEETGVPVIELDPFGSGDDDPGAYVRVMCKNLNVLRNAIR
jgi:zinc transport system substrate-binding protein